MGKLLYFKALSFLVLFIPGIVLATQYAYLPVTTQQGDVIQVVNTDTGFLVDSISLPGKPSGILTSQYGELVYVSHKDGSENASVSVINAYTNRLLRTIPINKLSPKGLIRDPVTYNRIWLARAGGITHIDASNSIVTHYDSITYAGQDLAVLLQGETYYILSLGVSSGVLGISLLDYASKAEIDTLSFGAVDQDPDLGNIFHGSMEVNSQTGEIYVTNAELHQLTIASLDGAGFAASPVTYALDIALPGGGVDTIQNVNHVQFHTYNAVGPNDQVTYVAYGVQNPANIGASPCNGNSGGIKVLNSTNGQELNNDLYFNAGEWPGASSHLARLNVMDNGRLLAIYSIYCSGETGGTYLGEISVRPPTEFNSQYVFTQVSNIKLGEFINIVGDFVGPHCEFCPYGEKLEAKKPRRPAAVSPILLIALLPVFWLRRVRAG